jgi:predicted naringenin-chalcone synthase
MALLVHIATASPPFVVSQERAATELKKRMGGRPAVARMIDAACSHSGIATRCVVVSDAEPSVTEKFYPESPDGVAPTTSRRMGLYREWSATLALEAAGRVLEETGTPPSAVTRLITVSCTGFSAPNFDYPLIMSLGIPANVQRTHIGFMGCAAAVVGMTSVLESLQREESNDAVTLLVALELCSLHLQTEPTRDNILANMIFADGCAAALFRASAPGGAKARLLRTRSLLFPESREYMGWDIGDHGFEMILSSNLPAIIAGQAVPAARAILRDLGVDADRIPYWALHPGGRAIIDALANGLGLTEVQAAPSRKVLREYGNMSSASILFVLRELFERHRIAQGDLLCAIAFGPGLTMELALFEGA